ncbi:MAG TPA: hypothetical protein VGZ26_08280 [Pirellulales bacterium]|nr:hypothetical protein [Pirellulales bacterium]
MVQRQSTPQRWRRPVRIVQGEPDIPIQPASGVPAKTAGLTKFSGRSPDRQAATCRAVAALAS